MTKTYLAIDLSKVGAIGVVALRADTGGILASMYAKEGKKGWMLYRNVSGKSTPDLDYGPVEYDVLWSIILDRFSPAAVVIEDTFVGKSGTTAMKLAEARGFLMGTLYLLSDKTLDFHKLRPDDWRTTICKAHGLVSWPRDRDSGKELSIKLAERVMGYLPLNDDEADAIHIGMAFYMQGRTL